MWTHEDIKCIVEYYDAVIGGLPLDDVPNEYRDAVQALIV